MDVIQNVHSSTFSRLNTADFGDDSAPLIAREIEENNLLTSSAESVSKLRQIGTESHQYEPDESEVWRHHELLRYGVFHDSCNSRLIAKCNLLIYSAAKWRTKIIGGTRIKPWK